MVAFGSVKMADPRVPLGSRRLQKRLFYLFPRQGAVTKGRIFSSVFSLIPFTSVKLSRSGNGPCRSR